MGIVGMEVAVYYHEQGYYLLQHEQGYYLLQRLYHLLEPSTPTPLSTHEVEEAEQYV